MRFNLPKRLCSVQQTIFQLDVRDKDYIGVDLHNYRKERTIAGEEARCQDKVRLAHFAVPRCTYSRSHHRAEPIFIEIS